MIYEFNGVRPVVHASAFVHPLAAVTGNVVIGRDVYVGPGAAIRGDWGAVEIGDGCNVQEKGVLHARVPRRKVVGAPGRIVKDVSDDMIAWKTEGTRLYQALPRQLHETLKPCEPLRERPAHRAPPAPPAEYRPWHETRDS